MEGAFVPFPVTGLRYHLWKDVEVVSDMEMWRKTFLGKKNTHMLTDKKGNISRKRPIVSVSERQRENLNGVIRQKKCLIGHFICLSHFTYTLKLLNWMRYSNVVW